MQPLQLRRCDQYAIDDLWLAGAASPKLVSAAAVHMYPSPIEFPAFYNAEKGNKFPGMADCGRARTAR
jgi:hypothetical protein